MTRAKRSVVYVIVFIFVISALLLIPQRGLAFTPKTEYRMTLNVGPTFYWGMGAQKFAELVKEKTNGQINIKPYYGSELVKGAQMNSIQMVSYGVIDCAYESTINSASTIQEMNIFSLPFFINTFENLDKIEYGEAGKAVFEAMDKVGVVGLAWAENGFRQVTNSKKAINKPEDLKGLRIRVCPTPIFIDIYKRLGVDPINMNWGDAVTAFQQGAVDGQENPVGVLLPVHIYQYHKYCTFWNYLVDPVIIYWNKAEWQTFPDSIKKAIKDAAVESARFEKALCRAGLDGNKSINILKKEFNYKMENPDPISFLREKGMNVKTSLTPEELAAFKAKTQPVYKKWIKIIGKDLYKKALKDMGK